MFDVYIRRKDLRKIEILSPRVIKSIGIFESSFDARWMGFLVQSCTSLETLVFDECLLSDQDLCVILERLPKTVTKLSLYSNRLSFNSERLLPLHLTSINIGGNPIGNEGISRLAEMIENTTYNIRELCVSNLLGVTTGFEPLVRALSRNRTIEQLDISNNELTLNELKILMSREVRFKRLNVSNIYNIFPTNMCQVMTRQAAGTHELYMDGLRLVGQCSTNMFSHLKYLSIVDTEVDLVFSKSIQRSQLVGISLTDVETITHYLPKTIARIDMRGTKANLTVNHIYSLISSGRYPKLEYIDVRKCSTIQKYGLLCIYSKKPRGVVIRSDYESDAPFRMIDDFFLWNR